MENFDGGSRQVLGPNGTAAIWATYPQPFASVWTGLGDQVRRHIGMHGQGVTSLMFQTAAISGTLRTRLSVCPVLTSHTFPYFSSNTRKKMSRCSKDVCGRRRRRRRIIITFIYVKREMWNVLQVVLLDYCFIIFLLQKRRLSAGFQHGTAAAVHDGHVGSAQHDAQQGSVSHR